MTTKSVVIRPAHRLESDKYFSLWRLYIVQRQISTLAQRKIHCLLSGGNTLEEIFSDMCVHPERDWNEVRQKEEKEILHLQIVPRKAPKTRAKYL